MAATLNTRVTELFGIKHPVVQGAMARIADASLAAAVSEAGGLGIIACGGASLEWIEEQVLRARSLTDKPLGANVMLMDPHAEEAAHLLARLKIDVITTGAGSPAAYMKLWKGAGIKVVPVVASAALARRMERLGADAVVAEGTESGGHVGELTTMALVPSVRQAVSIPVIAAGGIADGRGLLAALVLGAEGVQCGTRFLTVEECTVHDAWKQKVLGAKDSDTIVTGRGTGHPVRCLKNRFARECRKREMSASDPAELEGLYAGSLARAVAGDVEGGSVMAGQIAAIVSERKTAGDVISEMVEQAVALGALSAQSLVEANARRAQEAGTSACASASAVSPACEPANAAAQASAEGSLTAQPATPAREERA